MPHIESPISDLDHTPQLFPSQKVKIWAGLITKAHYLEGLLTLHYSLQKAGTKYPLVALYIDNLPAEIHEALDVRGIRKRRVPYLTPNVSKDYGIDKRFKDVWTRLTTFSLVEYERVVLLDLDMLVVKNMDELMDVNLNCDDRVFAACHFCTCNPLAKPKPSSTWPYFTYAGELWGWNPEDFSDGTIQPGGGAMVNAGLLVIAPSLTLYDQVLECLSDTELVQTFNFPEQELLAHVFVNRWVSLPYIYNALKTMRWKDVHDTIWDDDQVKNIHYVLKKKSWMETDQERQDLKLDPLHYVWWNLNNERVRKEQEKLLGIGFQG